MKKLLFIVLAMMLLSVSFVAADVNKINFGKNQSNPSQMIPMLVDAEGRQLMNINLVNLTSGSISLNGTKIFDWGDIVNAPLFPSFLLANGLTPLTGLWNFGSFGINGSGDISTTGNTSSNNTYISNILRSNKGNFEHNFEIIPGSNWTFKEADGDTIRVNEDIVPSPLPVVFGDTSRTGLYVVITNGTLAGRVLNVKETIEGVLPPIIPDGFKFTDFNDFTLAEDNMVAGDSGYFINVSSSGDVLIDGELNITQTLYGKDGVFSHSLSWNGIVNNNLTFDETLDTDKDYGLIMNGRGLLFGDRTDFTGGYIEWRTGTGNDLAKTRAYTTMNGLGRFVWDPNLRNASTGGADNGTAWVHFPTGSASFAQGNFTIDIDGNTTAPFYFGSGEFLTGITHTVDTWATNFTFYYNKTEVDNNFTFFVPYTGATANLDLGSFNYSTTGLFNGLGISTSSTEVNFSLEGSTNLVNETTIVMEGGDVSLSPTNPVHFHIFGEENGNIDGSNGGFEWSGGNGMEARVLTIAPCDGVVYKAAMYCEVSSTTTTEVNITLNQVDQDCSVFSPGSNDGITGYGECDISLEENDGISWRTTEFGTGVTENQCIVEAWGRCNG